MGSGDGQAAARVRTRLSPEDNFCVVVRCERLVNVVWLHVETASRAVEKTAHQEQPILGAAGHQVKGRSPAEDDSVVRGSQPLDAKLLRRKQNSETLWIPRTAEMRVRTSTSKRLSANSPMPQTVSVLSAHI